MALTTFTWTNTAGGTWDNAAANWGLSGAAASGAPGTNNPVLIMSGASSNYTITVNSNITFGTTSGAAGTSALTVNDAHATLDVGAGGILNFGFNGTGYTGLTLTAGTIKLDGGTINVLASRSVTLKGGTLDISSGLFSTTGTLAEQSGLIKFSSSGGTLDLQGGISGAVTVNFGTNANAGTLYWDSTTYASLNTSATSGTYLTLADFYNGAGQDVLKIKAPTTGTITIASWSDTDANNATLGLSISGTTRYIKVTSSLGGLTTVNPFSLSAFTPGYYTLTDNLPCFLRGTRIATLRGEVAVEDLRIGDLVVTAGGDTQPIRWIGTRGYIARLVHTHHHAALMPVRIAAGALGEASPTRDLFVSPEHMMCLDGVLVPAEKLLNGTTITRAEGLDVVQYFHVELPRHSVLYAEGAGAESFLDTGNRNMFSNVLEYLALATDLDAPRPAPCLPIVTDGAALDGIRARLAARAERLGLATTDNADLHLLVDGATLRPCAQDNDAVRFAVPAGARQVRIVSRSVVLAEMDPASDDRRRLGVCLAGLSLRDGGFTLDVAPDHAGLVTGFQAAEPGHRWTDGNALLPEALVAAMPDGFTLELRLVRTGLRYPAPAPAETIALAA